MLKIAELSAHYGSVQALHNVSVTVDEGEIVTLIGANGAGKSTLMNTFFGHPRASGGSIQLEGRELTRLRPHEIAKLDVAIVPEGRRIFQRMTVLENLLMGDTSRDKQTARDIERMIEMFPILGSRATQRAGTLSGGEQQMLAIARALMSHPRLLMLDEPSLGLAPIYIKKIFSVIQDLNREHGMTILLVEQNAHHALRVAHRGYVLQHGHIALEGDGQSLLADPAVRAAYLEGDTAQLDAA
jgi:branched-chain amino acid transport system ATP-binding protein